MNLWQRLKIGSYLAQWLLLGCGLLILGGFVAWNLYAAYSTADVLERERLTAQARVIDQNLTRQLVAMNLALESIRADLPYLNTQTDAQRLITRRLQAMREAMPGTRAITIFDTQGTLTARSPDQFVGQNFSNREYFQIARQGGDSTTLYVSPPFLAATGEYVINLVKVIKNAQGDFAGALLASLDPAYFSVLLDSVRYAPDMTSALVDSSGKLFLRLPTQPGVEGKNLTEPGSLYTRHLENGQKTTVLTGLSYVAGKDRMAVFVTIKPDSVPMDKPLVLVIARDLASIFEPWRQSVYANAILFTLLVLSSTAALLISQRRQRVYERLVARQEQARLQAEAELRIAAAAFDSQEGMMVTNAQCVVLRVNKAFSQTTGYTPEEIVGKTPRLLRSGRHDTDFYRAMWTSIHQTGAWQGEIWDRRKDGSVYPKWLTISQVKDDSGQVTHYIGTHYDITERKKAEDRINTLAFYDQLTGLPNRILLLDRLNRAMTASARSGSHGALLFIDLDNFKTLNDTQGHDMGDLLLQQVAQRFKQCIRNDDTAARQGGDEFVILLTGLGLDAHDAAMAAESIAAKILAEHNRTYRLSDADYHCGASIGVTLFKGQTTSVDDVMKQADLAMYRAKSSGRNAVRFFDPTMEAAIQARTLLEHDLRCAVDAQQFLLHYQPQVDGAQRITGAEVLVRWLHPQRGMVPPAEFIPLAEETDLILPLGLWVLETACRQLARWAAHPHMAELTVAVNVSANQLQQGNFVDQVLNVLRQTGANPQCLKLELTESLLVRNIEASIEKIAALKAAGVGFSLDDFGTGYSSLTYLKRLPLDQLKIDQSFVRDVLSDPNDAAIAKTVVELAKILGLSVIAEGVETREQRDFLVSQGCHAYQGYYFSKPVPLDEFEQLLG